MYLVTKHKAIRVLGFCIPRKWESGRYTNVGGEPKENFAPDRNTQRKRLLGNAPNTCRSSDPFCRCLVFVLGVRSDGSTFFVTTLAAVGKCMETFSNVQNM